MSRLRTTVLAGLVVLAGAATVLAAQVGIGKDKTLAAQPKANSIAELVKRYDSTSCIDCHQDAHDEWDRSLHARSIFGSGRTAATFKTAIINGAMDWPASGVKSMKDVKVEHLMGCAKCHLPQLADATDKVAQEIMTTINDWQDALMDDDDDKAEAAEATLTSLNINCLICHNRNAIIHKWTDGYPQKDAVYGSKDGDHPDEKFPKMVKGEVMSESIMCGQCHGLGPNFELDNPTQCATAYGSYLFSYVPNGGNKTCQQCHMHESKLGHDMQSYRAKVMSDKAVDMKVTTSAVYWRDNTTIKPKVAVDVALTNNAGHGVPDG